MSQRFDRWVIFLHQLEAIFMLKQASEVVRSRQSFLMSQTCPMFRNVHTHLKRFVLQVHFQQRVSHQVPEAAAVEITVRLRVTPAIVDLRELQPTELQEVGTMEILVLTEHLCTKSLCSSHPCVSASSQKSALSHLVFSMTEL